MTHVFVTVVLRTIVRRVRRISKNNYNAHLSSILFFFENLTVYEVMRTNIAQPDWPQMTI